MTSGPARAKLDSMKDRLRRVRVTSLSLVLGLLTATIVPAQGVGEALVTLRKMEVAGLAAFSRDDVAVALLNDATTLTAVQRSLDAETAALVADRVRELHRRGGYAQAEATGKLADGVLRVDLHAGPRFRSGEVRCTGNQVVSAAALRERFAARPQAPMWATDEEKSAANSDARRAWIDGEFPTMDDRAAERMQRIVRDAYRERGRYGARAAVEFVPDGERMTLVVTVASEGHEVRMRSVKLDGEDETAAAAVLSSVGFVRDTLATREAVGALRYGLEATGLYLHVDVAVDDEAPASLDPLVVKVKPRPGAPALDAVSPRDVEQVQRALRGLVVRVERGDTLRVTCTLTEPVPMGESLRYLPGVASVQVGRDGFLLDVERLQFREAPATRTVFGMCGLGCLFRCGEACAVWRTGVPMPMELRLASQLAESGEFEFRWGAKFHTRGTSLLDCSLHPATARQVIVRASSVQRDGETLALRFGETTVRIAADGALLDEEIAFTAQQHHFAIAWAKDGLGEMTRAFDGVAVTSNLGEVVTTVLAAIGSQLATADPRVPALLREGVSTAAAALEPGVQGDRPAPSRAPVLDNPTTSVPALFGMILASTVVNREYRGCLPVICSAFACVLLGDSRAAKVAFDMLAEDGSAGPLHRGTVAIGFRLLGNERAADHFRDLAASRATFDDCWRDVADLAASFPALHGLPARIGARWRTAPELKELFTGVADGAAGDLAAWRKGLELLWNNGGERLLRDALAK